MKITKGFSKNSGYPYEIKEFTSWEEVKESDLISNEDKLAFLNYGWGIKQHHTQRERHLGITKVKDHPNERGSTR